MWQEELNAAIEAGLIARKAILDIYNKPFEVEIKSDNSPVTLADKTADRIIHDYLAEKFPDHGFLTEESDDDLLRLCKEFVWIIDPVDGTKDFVARDGGFTTNIALCRNHELIVGVVIIPLTGEIYYAIKGEGSYYINGDHKEKIHVNDKTSELTCLTSVFHCTEEEKRLISIHSDKITKVEKYGSSLKPCRIAHGLAEITYRLSPYTKEWDTAACQIIVEEAGGLFCEPDGSPIKYNREDVYNRNGYICVNRKENILL